MAALPVIFIFDLDYTLIGNRFPYEYVQDIKQFIANACLTEKIGADEVGPGLSKSDSRVYDPKLAFDPNLLRPFLKESLDQLSELFHGCAEFFVFTAGDTKGVNEFIPLIEKQFGLKFNRPLLSNIDTTLNESGGTEKSIIMHFPKYIQSLVGRYPALKDEKKAEFVKQHRTVFFDDNDWTEEKSRSKFIQNVPYTYWPTFDLLESIPVRVRAMPLIRDFLKRKYFKYVFVEPYGPKPANRREMDYHLFMANLHRVDADANEAALKDTFFRDFVDSVRPFAGLVKPFSDVHMAKIRASLKASHTLYGGLKKDSL